MGPDERFWVSIVLGKVSVDGALQVDDRMEDAAADALPVIFEKKLSTALSPEAEVGVKWKIRRG